MLINQENEQQEQNNDVETQTNSQTNLITNRATQTTTNQPRTLVVSMRGFHQEVFRSSEYEFEDIISDVDTTSILTPFDHQSNQIAKIKKKIANSLGLHLQVNRFLNSGCKPTYIQQKYDVFFFVCQHFWDITTLNSIYNWRENSRYAVAWIDEIWACELLQTKAKLCIELLKKFDYIFTTQSASVDAIAKLTQRPCVSIPYGVDAIKFFPNPITQERPIDVYSIGRRSPKIHQALLNLSNQTNFLYIYDSLKVSEMFNYQEHRSLYSNIIKRTRYFIANKAKFDQPQQTGGQEEIGARFFEGAAGGSVMIGILPECNAFAENFDWEDAAIAIPPGGEDNFTAFLAELDSQPERLQRIRRENLINSLLRHDWVYRWQQILKILDINITPAMQTRISHLQTLANSLHSHSPH